MMPDATVTSDAVVAAVRAGGGEVTAAELADALGLHITTARYHLDRLAETGRVRSKALRAGGRGRPRLTYVLVDADRARSELISVLAGAVARGEGPEGAVAAGTAWADSVEVAQGNAADAVATEFARLGFGPIMEGGTVELHDCPFRDAARQAPGVVCRVHLGMAERIAERAEPGATVTLEPFVTDTMCRVVVLPPQ